MEEAEWAIEVMKELGVPIACTMRMGPTGDQHDVSVGECAVRMAKAGEETKPKKSPSQALWW